MRVGPFEFRSVTAVDFEFQAPPGERPRPICLVARDLDSGRTLRVWEDELRALPGPPYPVGREDLVVAYYASAELGCHLALGWPLPARVLDLYVEFRRLTNGRPTPCGRGLLGALTWFGLDGLAAVEKAEMRELALRGGPWTAAERTMLLDYCQSDVDALARLLPRMLPTLDVPRAVYRGRYMNAVARMEHIGVPIDVEALARLRTSWTDIQERLVKRIDQDYGVFDGRHFRTRRFAEWLAARHIPWPRLHSGSLALDDDTWREMAWAHPAVAPLLVEAPLEALDTTELTSIGGRTCRGTHASPTWWAPPPRRRSWARWAAAPRGTPPCW
jgi:hypothetical protein